MGVHTHYLPLGVGKNEVVQEVRRQLSSTCEPGLLIDHAWYDQSDAGRFAVTGNDSDKMFFKVASLRNVEETWPYFHDGSVQRLEEAVRLMAWHQLNEELTESQVASITTWLRTLTGPVPFEYINEPTLPPSPMPESYVGG